MSIKTIIFDYDGVIVDSFPGSLNIYKKICDSLKIPFNYTLEEFKKIYGKTSGEAYKNLGITENLKSEANKIWKEEVLKQTPSLFEGIRETLTKLSKKYSLILLSANHLIEVESKLKYYNLNPLFSKMIARTNEKSPRDIKVQKIKEYIKESNQTTEEIVLIGDREIDYEEGTAAGLKHIILVEYGWGYNKDNLNEHKQEIIVHSPLDIIKAVEHIEKTLT